MLFGQITDEWVELCPRPRPEREHRVAVLAIIYRRLGVPLHHRRKLEKIAHHHDLHPAKRLLPVTRGTQDHIPHLEHTAREHRDLVDDQHFGVLRTPFHVGFIGYLRHIPFSEIVPYADAAPRMDGHPADMRRRDAGRRGDGGFDTMLAEPPPIRIDGICLTAPRLAREKNIRARLQNLERFVLCHEEEYTLSTAPPQNKNER